MPSDIEIIVRYDSTPGLNAVIGRAMRRWLTAATRSGMIQQVHIILNGGPYLTGDEVAAFWRRELPPDAVEDVLVDGQSLKVGPVSFQLKSESRNGSRVRG